MVDKKLLIVHCQLSIVITLPLPLGEVSRLGVTERAAFCILNSAFCIVFLYPFYNERR